MKWRAFIDQLWRDLAFAVRMLRRNPLFAFAAIASLTLGIGANTAVFSLIDSLVLRPLQVRDPGQLDGRLLSNAGGSSRDRTLACAIGRQV